MSAGRNCAQLRRKFTSPKSWSPIRRDIFAAPFLLFRLSVEPHLQESSAAWYVRGVSLYQAVALPFATATSPGSIALRDPRRFVFRWPYCAVWSTPWDPSPRSSQGLQLLIVFASVHGAPTTSPPLLEMVAIPGFRLTLEPLV